MMLNARLHCRLLLSGLALAILMPAAARAQGLVEYAIILVLADGTSVGSSYDVCVYNPGNIAESATFEFDRSDPMAPPERFEVAVDPGQTKCQDISLTQSGALLGIREIPGAPADGILPSYAGTSFSSPTSVVTQVYMKDPATGVRTGVVPLEQGQLMLITIPGS